MHLSSVYVFLSCVLLLSPVVASSLLPIHDSQSNLDDSGFLTPPDGFQPPGSPDIGVTFFEPPPPPPPYQDDILGSPPIGAPDNGNTDFLPSVPPPPAPTYDVTPTFVPPPTSDTPLPTPLLPVILPPPPDSSLPLSPQLPVTSPPPDSSMPQSPQLPLASSPPLYSTLPASPNSPLPYHHPGGTQPGTSTAAAPFGVNPSGENQGQGQQFGQANSGLFGQQQSSNGLPFGGQIGSCGSTRADFIGIAMAFIGVLLIYWV